MPEVLAKKILWTTSVTLPCSKGFVASQPEAIFIKLQFFSQKNSTAPTESNRSFGLVIITGVWEGKLGVVLYGSQNVSGFMFKNELLPLITELAVVLKHLVAIHLWCPQKITNCVTPNSLHLQKWTIDLLFKKNCKHVTNFKTPPPPFMWTS